MADRLKKEVLQDEVTARTKPVSQHCGHLKPRGWFYAKGGSGDHAATVHQDPDGQ